MSDHSSLAKAACGSHSAPDPSTPWWCSWYGESGTFELYAPWWISGTADHDGKEWDTICAAVIAESEDAVRALIAKAHDDKQEPWFRFIEPRPADWSPFNGRFQAATWMMWPLRHPEQALSGASEP